MNASSNLRRAEPPEWVQQQHKTMLRWINSKLSLELTDLSKDLSDGSVLIQLINKIITEMDLESTDLKLYLLKPLHAKPKMMLQKMENINDFLEFIRIVLKINITSISSDNIIEGNLKLILGLIWSLFIFSTTSSIGLMNDGNSVIQIKAILLKWINSIYKMSPVTNFDRDWSLDINSPDAIFYAIMKAYLPSSELIKLTESKFQNTKNILQHAESLGIPKLADIEDFKNLVPDEKCILFYILEWFKFFELGNFDVVNPDTAGDDASPIVPAKTYDEVVIQMAELIKNKLEYETRALRFSNKVLSTSKKLNAIVQHFEEETSKMLLLLSDWQNIMQGSSETDGLKAIDIDEESFNVIADSINKEVDILINSTQYYEEHAQVVNTLSDTEIQQLSVIYRTSVSALHHLGENFTFDISKSLEIDALRTKVSRLIQERTQTTNKLYEISTRILAHQASLRAYEYLSSMKGYNSSPSSSPSRCVVAEKVAAKLVEMIAQLQQFETKMQPTSSATSSHETSSSDIPKTKSNNIGQEYNDFKDEIFAFDSKFINNETELTMILESLTSDNLNPTYIKQFISFVPTKTVNSNFNDSDFSLNLESEDEDSEIDNSRLIFENQRRKIGSQLCFEKVYDMVDFFDQFENGLKF